MTRFKIEEHLKLKNLYEGCEGQLKASKDIKKMVHETTFVNGFQIIWASCRLKRLESKQSLINR